MKENYYDKNFYGIFAIMTFLAFCGAIVLTDAYYGGTTPTKVINEKIQIIDLTKFYDGNLRSEMWAVKTNDSQFDRNFLVEDCPFLKVGNLFNVTVDIFPKANHTSIWQCS